MSESTHSLTQSTVGLLYPGVGADDDFSRVAARFPELLRLPLVRTSVGVDHHEVGALLDLGSPERLAEGAHRLRPYHPGSVMWACTSGSFVFGPDGARRQVAELAELLGVPASSTSLAFVAALRHLGIDSVAIAASYPDDVAQRFVDFLAADHITVTALQSHGIETAASVGELTAGEVSALVQSVPTDGAGAVVVPDTAMHSLDYLDDLETAAGLPVLTANQVTLFEGLRLQGSTPKLTGLGTLFR